MICSNCKKEVSSDAIFCQFCGYNLESIQKRLSINENDSKNPQSVLSNSESDDMIEIEVEVDNQEQVLSNPNNFWNLEKLMDIYDNLYFKIMVLFVFLAPFCIIKGLNDYANLPQSVFIQIGSLLLITLLFLKSSIRKKEFLLTPFHLPLLLFLIWITISLSIAINRYEGLYIYMLWLPTIVVYIIIVQSLNNNNECEIILKTVFCSGFLVALLGVIQHLFAFSWVPQTVSPSSTFANKEMCTHFIVITLPIGFCFLFSGKKLSNWYYSLACSIMLIFIVYTASFVAFIAIFIQLNTFIILLIIERIRSQIHLRLNSNKIASIVFGVVLFLVMINVSFSSSFFEWKYLEHKTKLMDDIKGTKNASLKIRLSLFSNCIEMIKENLITGVGIGNFNVYYPKYCRKSARDKKFSEQFQAKNVHNDYLQVWSETGTIGIILLLYFFLVLFHVIKNTFTQNIDETTAYILIAIVVGITGLMVSAFFSFPFQRSIPPFTFMIFVGILGYLSSYQKIIFSSYVYLILFCITLLILIKLIPIEVNLIKSDKHYQNIQSAEKNNDWNVVISEAKKAYILNPYKKRVLSYMGRAYIELKKPKQGIEILQKILVSYPFYMNAMLNLGVAYDYTNNYNNALAMYNKVIEILPNCAKAHNGIANIYMKQKKLNKALTEFRLAGGFDQDNAVIFFNIGIVSLNLKLYQEAQSAFHKAIFLKPEWAMPYKNLGVIHFNYLDEKIAGAKYFKKALDIDPTIKDHDQMQQIVNKFVLN